MAWVSLASHSPANVTASKAGPQARTYFFPPTKGLYGKLK